MRHRGALLETGRSPRETVTDQARQRALQGGQGLLDQLKVVAPVCSSPAPIPDTDVDVKRAKAEGIHGRKLAAQ